MQARRPPIWRFSLLALPTLLLLLASLPATAKDFYDCRALGIVFPESMGGLPLVGITDFEKRLPGLGVQLSYRKDEIKGDAYVYNCGVPSIPPGTKSKMISDHFYAVSQDIVKMEEFGNYKDVKVIIEQEQTKLGAVGFLHAEMQFTQDGIAMESHLYLTALSNQFVKIRFTFPASKAEKAKGIKEAYLRELGALLSDSKPKA